MKAKKIISITTAALLAAGMMGCGRSPSTDAKETGEVAKGASQGQAAHMV